MKLPFRSARSYVLEYTGLTLEQADAFEDLTIAALCLCRDFYDSRSIIVQNDRMNPVAAQILAMHEEITPQGYQILFKTGFMKLPPRRTISSNKNSG